MASKSLSCADARPAQLHSICSQRHARLQMLCLRPRHRIYLTHSLKELDSVREDEKITLVHLWEDQWLEHADVVHSRLLTMLGRSSHRWMARQTVAKRIDSHTTTNLLENHLWGSTQSRFRYGLFLRSDMQTLVAVATFSARWRKRRENGQVRHSHELIRYCSRRGETVVGGISKLISAFKQDQSPHEIVTVIDRDWGSGEGWSTLRLHASAGCRR